MSTLIELGVNINESTTTALDHHRMSLPLPLAIFCDQTMVAHVLLAMGADPDLADGDHGFSSVQSAVSKRNVCLLRSLIKAGANVRSLNNQGRMALYLAAECGKAEMVRLLVMEGGMGVDEVAGVRDSSSTALQAAAIFDQPVVAHVLLQLGADVHIGKENCSDALSLARRSKSHRVVMILEQHIEAENF